MLMGTYEQQPACHGLELETPGNFGHELLQPDLDRIAPIAGGRISSISPPSRSAGIKQIINGPFTFAPDGNPLVGPVPGLRGLLVAPAAVMAGFSQGGGCRIWRSPTG